MSAIVTIVLLKVAWTWQTPLGTFFLTFFLTLGPPFLAASPAVVAWAACAFAMEFLYAFYGYLPAGLGAAARAGMPLRGPLRVRALVWVRCPRTGSPLRWRRPR